MTATEGRLIKTIVPRRKDSYASFPTFACDEDRLVLFYRAGRKGNPATHGSAGRVMRMVFDRDAFLRAMIDPDLEDLSGLAEAETIFADDNEMDAIVTRMEDGVWTLATRTFAGEVMTTFMSMSASSDFSRRVAVRVPGVAWLVFFGKGMRVGDRYVFTAYGGLTEDRLYRPLLIETRDGEAFRLLAALPSPIDTVGLNECSLARDGNGYHLFMRQDTPPFGIWHARSPDLVTWTTPAPMIEHAHAPMALSHEGGVLLTFRRIISEDVAASALALPHDGPAVDLERYEGNIYDGGYTDPGVVDGWLLVFYYQGNRWGEPAIRCRAMRI